MIKNKNKYFSYFENQSDWLAIILFAVLIFSSVLNIDRTIAYFSDTESSTGNTFIAGTLTIDLDSKADFSSGLLYPADSVSTTIGITNTGSIDSKYMVQTSLLGSDVSACDYVTMTATSPVDTYTGLIGNFVSTTKPTVDTAWNFDFTVDSDIPPSVWGKTCSFKWSYTAWQTDFSDSSSGFSNKIEKQGIIEIGQAVVLNEVLYYPNTSASAPADREFIELYNNSNVSVDLAGWQISEMSGSTEHKYTITTAASGSYRAVPYGGSTIILANNWIVLQLSDSSALNNDGDTIRLYDNGGINKLDEYTYIGGKPKGNSDARMPDGIGNWVDPIPTPGVSNIVGEVISEENMATTTEDTPPPPLADSVLLLNQGGESEATTTKEMIASTTEEVLEEVTATTTASTTEETVIGDDTATTTDEVIVETIETTTEEIINEGELATTTEEIENVTEPGSEEVPASVTEEQIEPTSEVEEIVEPVTEAAVESVIETEPAPIIE